MYNILEQYVCTAPFNYLEIHKEKVFGCCPSWMTIPYGDTNNLSSVWNSDIAVKTRESVLDGSYRYCDKNKCAYLSQLINTNIPTDIFIKKSQDISLNNGPTRLNLSFDLSCNLSCPSCRKNISNDDELLNINRILKNVSLEFKNTVTYIYISGTCDPFASKTFRNFLKNFNIDMFPKLEHIHLHTNGLLLTEQMWNEIENVHKYIKSIEISIDAATKDTYEKIRRGGKWETIIKNINFISTIPTIKEKSYSFVVQDTNYKEMKMFYDMIVNLPHINKRYIIYFGKILNWGTYSDDEFLIKQIWNENHINFNDFILELRKVGIIYKSINNMNDIIEKYNLQPNKNRLI